MDTTRIQPVGGHHAIEVMAIGIEWAAPLDEAQLDALLRVYEGDEKLKGFLPSFAASQALVMQGMQKFVAGDPAELHAIDPKNIVPPQFVAKSAGFNAQRFDKGGTVEWVAAIRPEFLSCNCGVYDRWTNVKPQAVSILRPFIDAAMALGAQINAIGLQYQDAFRLIDGASPAVTKELFRTNGNWLPAHLFEQPSFWHCHQGWFSEGTGRRRVLNNVATEITDAISSNYARIGGQHRVFASSVDAKTVIPIGVDDIESILGCLHDENIKVINRMLSDEALEAIGCSVRG